jgi:putative tryptophan/tyrosine transport system substrate-binding protein
MTRLFIRLLVILTFGLLVIPLAAGAPKPGKVYRLGLFHVGLDHVPPSLDSLREELRTLGYVEGTNLVLDWRNLPDEEAAGETAQAFVRQHVDLIVAFENQTARAAKVATTEIPIVFAHVTDPVADELVDNLAHPGRNLTGFVSPSVELTTKRLEFFRECIPSLRRVLVLTDPHDPTTPRLLAQVRTASATLHLVLVEHAVTEQADIERVFGALTSGEVDGVFVVSPNLHLKFSTFHRI